MSEPISPERLAGHRRWVKDHKNNEYQREGSLRVAELLDELEAVTREAESESSRANDAILALSRADRRLQEAEAALARVKALHLAKALEFTDICNGCGLPWPCLTLCAIEGADDEQ